MDSPLNEQPELRVAGNPAVKQQPLDRRINFRLTGVLCCV